MIRPILSSGLDPVISSTIYFEHRAHQSIFLKATKCQGRCRCHISSKKPWREFCVQVASQRSHEQTAIAAILSDMDAEIAALEQRRDKTRAIKQGMMQRSLTGRVRLVKPSHATEATTC